jgi:hypothetical protein
MPESIFIKLGMHIMAPEPITMAYFINLSDQFVGLYEYPSTVARQRLGKNVSAAINTHEKIEELSETFVFYAVRVLTNESKRIVRPRTT